MLSLHSTALHDGVLCCVVLCCLPVQGKPLSFGGTGGLVHDDDGTIVAYAMTGKALHFWKATDEHATEWIESETNVTACCNDPIGG